MALGDHQSMRACAICSFDAPLMVKKLKLVGVWFSLYFLVMGIL
ncbi:hypothetical protein HPNQ4200_0854 [Helicobacter pylori NQ4200]|uniref:Uncharacterized protein n=1 Tax=Helicobacter pylori NQ4200 TaxID=992024 RepID=I9Q5A3_HELPX|nr:hypothetical protein HPNQ4200_0854 [Helicobacter pylori NQ4200]